MSLIVDERVDIAPAPRERMAQRSLRAAISSRTIRTPVLTPPLPGGATELPHHRQAFAKEDLANILSIYADPDERAAKVVALPGISDLNRASD